MTPEEKKALEEYKAKNAQATQANKMIANLNATIKAVRADMASASPNFEKDQSDMKSAVDAKPDEGLLWVTYGDTLQGGGDHLAAEDRANKKAPQTDDAVIKQYTDAADAYKKGADLLAASKKPNPADEAIAYNQMGNALAKAGKTTGFFGGIRERRQAGARQRGNVLRQRGGGDVQRRASRTARWQPRRRRLPPIRSGRTRTLSRGRC